MDSFLRAQLFIDKSSPSLILFLCVELLNDEGESEQEQRDSLLLKTEIVSLLQLLLSLYGGPGALLLCGVNPLSLCAGSSSTRPHLNTLSHTASAAAEQSLFVEREGESRPLAESSSSTNMSSDSPIHTSTRSAPPSHAKRSHAISQSSDSQPRPLSREDSLSVSWRDINAHSVDLSPANAEANKLVITSLCRAWRACWKQVDNDLSLFGRPENSSSNSKDSSNNGNLSSGGKRNVVVINGELDFVSENQWLLVRLARELTLFLNDLVGLLSEVQRSAMLRGESFTYVAEFMFQFWSNSLPALLQLSERDIAHLNNLDDKM